MEGQIAVEAEPQSDPGPGSGEEPGLEDRSHTDQSSGNFLRLTPVMLVGHSPTLKGEGLGSQNH